MSVPTSTRPSTLGPRVTVRCTECGESRNIQDAAGRDGWEKLPACRGRHPHLQRFTPCGKPLRLIVLGASNLWFGVTASALHLPQGQSVDDLVIANWQILGAQPDPDVAQAIIEVMDALRGLRGAPIGEVWACIEKLRAAGGPGPESADAEHRVRVLISRVRDLLGDPAAIERVRDAGEYGRTRYRLAPSVRFALVDPLFSSNVT